MLDADNFVGARVDARKGLEHFLVHVVNVATVND